MQQRIERVRGTLEEQQLDALLVEGAAGRRYLSGFTGSAGWLLISRERAILFSDSRYTIRARREAPAFEFVQVSDLAPLPAQLAEQVRALGLRRIGFEAEHATVASFGRLERALADAGAAVEWVPTEGLVRKLRQIKDAAEIATLRRAIQITDDAFAAVRPRLRPAMRERDVAWELEKAMRERGADGLAFSIIVAAGPNGAQPHAQAGDEPLGVGRPVVMDFGALLDGYHADMTRTVILGAADDRFRHIYAIVAEAERVAASGVRVGMLGRDADALARDVIAAAGYGDNFGHGLGHGVGLEIHEGPSLRLLNAEPLAAGSVFSIEPGIYLPEWGGVRIEDLVLLTDAGPEVLTRSPKEPVVEITED